MSDLENYAFSSKVCEDWSAFMEVLQSKVLKFESEIVILVHLSSSILENEYQKHFQGKHV